MIYCQLPNGQFIPITWKFIYSNQNGAYLPAITTCSLKQVTSVPTNLPSSSRTASCIGNSIGNSIATSNDIGIIQSIGTAVGNSSVVGNDFGLVQSISGLIYKSDNSLTNWTGDTAWTSANIPEYVCYPIGQTLLSSFGTADNQGIREGILYVENGNWYLAYDGGNGTTGWQSQYALSTDQGLTWTYQGVMGSGYNTVSTGTWYSVFLGWVGKWGSTYYVERGLSNVNFGAPNNGLPDTPYFWDRWTGTSSIGQCTTPDPAVPTDTNYYHLDGFVISQITPGNVVLLDGIYYSFVEITGVGYPTGLAVGNASAPDGPWTGAGLTVFAGSSINAFAGRNPENPRCFLSPTFPNNIYVILSNLIFTSGFFTDSNAIGYSSGLTNSNLQSATWKRIEQISPMSGSNAIGVASHITGPNGQLISGINGEIPITYDTNPTIGYTPGWHIGRKIAGAILEPALNCLQNLTNLTDSTWRQIVEPVNHTNCVIEWSTCVLSVGSSPQIRFLYRSTSGGTSGNCYSILFSGALNTTSVVLEKWISGVSTVIATSNGSMNYELLFNHRLKVVVNGSLHQFYLDGEQQWSHTDISISSGTYIGIGSSESNVQVRNITMRSSDLLTITGLSSGTPIVLRSYGNLPVVQTNANSSGIATITWNHYPHSALQIGNNIYDAQNGRFYGGDTYNFNGTSSTGSAPITTTLSSATISADGATLSVVFNQAVIGYYGLSLNGNPLLRYTSGEHTNTLVFEVAPLIVSGATITISYVSGNIIGINGSALGNFSGTSVVNNTSKIIIFYDNFNDANNTVLSSHVPTPINTPSATWSVITNAFKIQNNRVISENTGPGLSIINSGVSNCNIYCLLNAQASGSIGIVFRYQDSNNYWVAYYQLNPGSINTVCGLAKFVSGTATIMANGNTFNSTSDHIGTVILNGTSITMNWDGTNVLTINDSTFETATNHGLYCNGANEQYSNFQISV